MYVRVMGGIRGRCRTKLLELCESPSGGEPAVIHEGDRSYTWGREAT